MNITSQKVFSGILEVHVEGAGTPGAAFAFWEEFFRIAESSDAKAVLYISHVSNVIHKDHAMKLIDLFSNARKIRYFAYVRKVIPEAEEIQALTALRNLLQDIGFSFEIFYTRKEAQKWLKEKLSWESPSVI